MVGRGLEQELRRRAEATIESIRNEAHEEVKRLELEASRALEARRRSTLGDEEREYRRSTRRKIAAQRRESLRAVLLARARVVDRVLERARALLPAAGRSDQYLSTVRDQVVESLRFFDPGNAVIRCRPEMVPLVQEAFEGDSQVEVRVDPELSAGFILSNHAGDLRVDMRLERRFEWRRPEFAILIQSSLRRE